MTNKIILLSGGTGVGTSSYAFELAKLLHIPTVLSTDAVREVLRTVLGSGINLALEESTYLVGQTEHYYAKSEDVQKSEILRGYKLQSKPVFTGVEGVITRAIKENIPLIVEGVHLIPGSIKQISNYEAIKDRFMECLIYINNQEVHKGRFISRQLMSPERSSKQYLDNFKEIRWIHDYLLEKARENNQFLIENSKSLGDGVAKIIKEHYS